MFFKAYQNSFLLEIQRETNAGTKQNQSKIAKLVCKMQWIVQFNNSIASEQQFVIGLRVATRKPLEER